MKLFVMSEGIVFWTGRSGDDNTLPPPTWDWSGVNMQHVTFGGEDHIRIHSIESIVLFVKICYDQ